MERPEIRDSSGKTIGGFVAENDSTPLEGANFVRKLQITTLDPSPFSDEIRYVRTLQVVNGSGSRLLIDEVSAPAGTDPASLKVQDLATAGKARVRIHASIPVDHPGQGGEAAASELAAVLRTMVGSFNPSVQ